MAGSEEGPRLERIPPITFFLGKEEEDALLQNGKVVLRHRHKEEERRVGEEVRADGPNGVYDIRIESAVKTSDAFPEDRDYTVILVKRVE